MTICVQSLKTSLLWPIHYRRVWKVFWCCIIIFKLDFVSRGKGHVERSIEYIRRKAFAHRDTFTSLEEAQQYLVSSWEAQQSALFKRKTHHELMLEEREKRAGKLTVAPFNPLELVELWVGKYKSVKYRQNHYSLSEGHVGKYIKLKRVRKKF